MRTTMILIASAAAGCSFNSTAAPSDGKAIDGKRIDAPVDSAIDAPPDGPNMDFGPPPFTVHLSALPGNAVTLPATINTDTAAMCATTASWVSATQPAATCFIVGSTIASGGGATVVTGSKPLVLVSTGAISLSKSLDVSSKRAGATLGAGGNYNVCDAFTANPSPGANGGGGGAGGTFMTQGGPGGIGNSDNQVVGGTAPSSLLGKPDFLRGGCAGQKGGNGNAGVAGNGGGAVYVVAAATITLATGSGINASGAGATHGSAFSGGSGGGTGGMIVLYAPMISVAAGVSLIANGGGASSGGDNNSNGHDGNDPATAGTAATGGVGPGGNGGSGAILTTGGSGGGGGGNNQGGGGGGGGVGYIRSNVMLTGSVASPAVDVVP